MLTLHSLLLLTSLAADDPPPSSPPAAPPSTLRVAVYDSPPFGFEEPDGTPGGLMVELWGDIADELDLEYETTLTDMDSLLTGLREDRFDVGLGAITITPEREALVDFSQPVNPSGTGIGVRVHQVDALWSYWPPILMALLRLIGTLLLVLLVTGTLVWLLERKRNPEMSHRRIVGFGEGLWWAAVTMTTVGYGDKVPRTTAGRAIAVLWMFTSLILVSLFTAEASSIFTTVRVQSSIDSVDDLRRVRVGAAEDSSGAEFCRRERITYRPYPGVDEAVQDMLDGEIDAVVSNIPVMRHLKHTRHPQEFVIVREPLVRNAMGIALPDDSPLREDVDRVLLGLVSEPKWQEAVYRYLGEE